WLERRRRELGLEGSVHFIGFQPSTATLLSAADALVLPSVEREELTFDGTTVPVRGTEGLPRSILEAMAFGIPGIASRVAGVDEQVDDGRTGFVVPPGDTERLADAIVRVGEDADFRAAAAEQARSIVAKRFTVEEAARGLANVLRSAASKRTAADRVLAS